MSVWNQFCMELVIYYMTLNSGMWNDSLTMQVGSSSNSWHVFGMPQFKSQPKHRQVFMVPLNPSRQMPEASQIQFRSVTTWANLVGWCEKKLEIYQFFAIVHKVLKSTLFGVANAVHFGEGPTYQWNVWFEVASRIITFSVEEDNTLNGYKCENLKSDNVKLSVCLIKHHTMPFHGVEVQLHTFLTLPLDQC